MVFVELISLCVRVEIFLGVIRRRDGEGGFSTGVVLSLENFGFGVWMGFFFFPIGGVRYGLDARRHDWFFQGLA